MYLAVQNFGIEIYKCKGDSSLIFCKNFVK